MHLVYDQCIQTWIASPWRFRPAAFRDQIAPDFSPAASPSQSDPATWPRRLALGFCYPGALGWCRHLWCVREVLGWRQWSSRRLRQRRLTCGSYDGIYPGFTWSRRLLHRSRAERETLQIQTELRARNVFLESCRVLSRTGWSVALFVVWLSMAGWRLEPTCVTWASWASVEALQLKIAIHR